MCLHLRAAAVAACCCIPWSAAFAQRAPAVPEIRLRAGMVITRSVRVVPGTYRLSAPASLDSAAVTIRGDDVTVDFRGATLEGAPRDADPDTFAGVALRVDGGRDVRIVNARAHGYRVGILARGTTRLTLVGNDLGYTWKPRLYSLVTHESLVDWLSYHHNEHDEWLRYGAAIYLADVRGGEIRGNRAEQGMNGLMLVRSDGLRIRDNDFSFNSGVGVALYRSSDDTIVHNRLDYDVRGYSHGYYRRGQDSAGLLIYEQSSRNVVAYNSVTHGGDGLFLWAGQHTMDTGAGGANDNLFFGNDFSFAPTNGMEATFSRNAFVANRIEGSDHGLWGGYSYGSTVAGNRFARNRVGIAIEHGQDNAIVANAFDGDSTGVQLWADSIEPSDWGYPKHRDTRSRDYRIDGNVFRGNRVAVRAAHTMGLSLDRNRLADADSALVLTDTTDVTVDTLPVGDAARVPALPAAYARLAPPGFGDSGVPSSSLARRGRDAIIVDEWGPYDWRSPKLWPVDSGRGPFVPLRVLGPTGRWRVVSRRGIQSLSRTTGRVGDTVTVTPATDSAGDWALALEYRGAATRSPRGVLRPAGAPYGFGYARFEPPIAWRVRFWAWADSTDPRSRADAFAALERQPALVERDDPRLDYEWYRPTIPSLPAERVALEATGRVTLAPGTYTLRTISDDAVRVWVDGALVIDHWSPHESMLDFAPLAGGPHELRVQYYQVDGWTELRVDIVRGAARSPGSPGPH